MSLPKNMHLIISCEHGGNIIPAAYQHYFHAHQEIIKTHYGYDKGALLLAQFMAKRFNSSLFYSTISRLLVDLNRSVHHYALFSRISAHFSTEMKKKILETYYFSYRNRLEKEILSIIKSQVAVLHLAIHSFTPELKGIERKADIGLLYDPQRSSEKSFCGLFKRLIKAENKHLMVRFNYPYLGRADGLTKYLRRLTLEQNYIGIEVEINQKHLLTENSFAHGIHQVMLTALAAVVDSSSSNNPTLFVL